MSFLAMKTIVVSCVLSFFMASVALAGSPVGNRWDKTKPISYTFSADMEEHKKSMMREAIQMIQNSSCISFEEAGDSDQKLVVSRKWWCMSSILGKEQSGPNEIGIWGCNTTVTFAHELLHMLGFTHEEARSDRDDYVTFVPSVPKGAIERKAPADTDNFGVPFNYGSALMSSAWYYKEIPEATMLPKDRQYIDTIYQQYEIAFTDFLALNRFYKCEESCESNQPLCENEGFPNPRDCSKCICPPFYSGALCNQSTLEKVDSETLFNYTIGPYYGLCYFTNTWENHLPHTPTIYEGPPGSHLLVTITKIDGADQFCMNECPLARLEIVDGADLRVAGKSFCCPDNASTTVLSSNSRVAIRASAPGCLESHMEAKISVVN